MSRTKTISTALADAVNENIPTAEPPLRDTDAARILGVSPSALRSWRQRGRGPRFMSYQGGAVRYLRADLEAFMASCRVSPGGEK